MIKVLYQITIVVIVLFFIGIFYFNSNYFIIKQKWKHRDGASAGDWIEFDNTLYSLQARTIFKRNIATGKIVFCIGKMLIIKNILTGEKGYYINK
jgi:hypothetical protein